MNFVTIYFSIILGAPPPAPPAPPPPALPPPPHQVLPPSFLSLQNHGAPVDENTLAYNLAAAQNNPAEFWNNYKFWRDFLQFINHGPHTLPNSLPNLPMALPNLQQMLHQAQIQGNRVLPNILPQQYMMPMMQPIPGYPFQPKISPPPGYVFSNGGLAPNINALLGNQQFPGSHLIGGSQLTATWKSADCRVRNDCPGSVFQQAKTPVFFIGPRICAF